VVGDESCSPLNSLETLWQLEFWFFVLIVLISYYTFLVNFECMSVNVRKICGSIGFALFCILFVFPTRTNSQVVAKAKPEKNYKNTQINLDEIRKRGFAYLKAGNWELAKADFETVLAVLPKDSLTIYGISLVFFNLQNYDESAKYVETGIKILSAEEGREELLADSLVLSAVLSAVRKDNSAAIVKLEKAIKIAPNNFDANLSLGRAYFGNGEIDKSVGSFRKATTIQPNNPQARFYLATALERLSDTAQALIEYRKVVLINPNSAEGNLGLGVLLIKTDGDKSLEGIKALEKAVELNPNLYEARITLGKTMIKLGRTEEAISHLQKAAKLSSGNPEPHFQLAIAYRKLGRKAEAEAESEIVKKIHENRRATNNR
jgi:tetratricopeptide (TPR) repeat protein